MILLQLKYLNIYKYILYYLFQSINPTVKFTSIFKEVCTSFTMCYVKFVVKDKKDFRG